MYTQIVFAHCNLYPIATIYYLRQGKECTSVWCSRLEYSRGSRTSDCRYISNFLSLSHSLKRCDFHSSYRRPKCLRFLNAVIRHDMIRCTVDIKTIGIYHATAAVNEELISPHQVLFWTNFIRVEHLSRRSIGQFNSF